MVINVNSLLNRPSFVLVRLRIFIACCLAPLLLSRVVSAYEAPLESRSVREAYFLGQRNDEATRKLLSAYLQALALPQKGAHIAEIELLTPYAQAVKISQGRTTGDYSAQQAEQEYSSRGDLIEVRVLILFTNTYSLTVDSADNRGRKSVAFRSVHFWKDFRFELRQEDGEIAPAYMDAVPQYSNNLYGWESVLSGAAVYLQYNARKIKSLPAKMRVLTPDGQQVSAAFDLGKLR